MSLMSHFCDGCGHAFTDEHGLFFHNCIPAAMPPPECDQSVDVARLSGVQVGTSKLNESGIEGGGREPNPADVRWCSHCGEGVTDFCRGKSEACPMQFKKLRPSVLPPMSEE